SPPGEDRVRVRGVRGARLPAATLLLYVASLSVGPMSESDLFFRIKAGQEILARHALPGRNLYSFTYPDYPDIDTAWLFEAGAALDRDPARPAAPLALLAAGAAAATLATPVGAGLYRYLWLHTTLPALHPVDEFRAASWISDAPLLVYGAAALAAALTVRPR